MNSLEFAKTASDRWCCTWLTKKGKGYGRRHPAAGEIPRHGPYDVQTGISPAPNRGRAGLQDVFGQTMVKALPARTIPWWASPRRCERHGVEGAGEGDAAPVLRLGIAEEHAVLFAAGMATMGFHPVVAIYSTFLQRAYDCISTTWRCRICVIFCMDRAGLSPQDGPSNRVV